MDIKPKLAVLGGSGHLGQALALKWVKAGYDVIIGSRDIFRAQQRLNLHHECLSFADYKSAVMLADIVVVTIPFPYSNEICKNLSLVLLNKILCMTTVSPDKHLVNSSIVAALQTELGKNIKVVAAFQTISAFLLKKSEIISQDILIAGNDKSACETIAKLAQDIHLSTIYCGKIEHALTLENMAITLIEINKHYENKIKHAGIKISGIIYESTAINGVT